MKFGHIELFVRNPLAAMDFYIGVLGFDLVDNQGDQFIWVAAGAMSILLRPGPPKEIPQSSGVASAGLVLYTDDLDRAICDLTARGLAFRGNDGSAKCVTFTDPDGHWFQLVNSNDH